MDQSTTVLFGLPGVRVQRVDRDVGGGRVVHVETAENTSASGCPSCAVVSTSVKGNVITRPVDLPFGKKHAVTARLIVRRVRDQNPAHVVANAQGELFAAWRHHAVFTDSPLVMVQAEADHRRHAIIEQVIAELKGGPLARLASDGSTPTAPGWCWPRWRSTSPAPPAHSPPGYARATTATIRRQLINVPARPVRSARRVRLRLPTNRPWTDAWLALFTAALGPPAAATP